VTVRSIRYGGKSARTGKPGIAHQEGSLSGYLKRGWSAIWYWGILAICCTLVVITLFQFQVSASNGIVQFLSRFVLTEENNFGVWWSGALLFVAGIHACDGYMLHRLQHPKVARGWLLISVILIILSADEISSLHERANAYLHFGSLLSLLPFGIILLVMLVVALISLWSSKEHRAQVWPVALAFFLFGTVAIQEILEKLVDWGQLVALRGTIEEGVELLGTMILLTVAMQNTRGIFARESTGSFPTFELVRPIGLVGLAIGLVLASAVGFVTAQLPDLSRGHPADWLSSMMFLLAALAAASGFLKHGENIGVLQWAMTGLCLVASASFVAVIPEGTFNVASFAVYARVPLFLAVSVLACAIWVSSSQNDGRVYVPATIAIAALALVLLFRTSMFFLFVLPTYLGLLVYYVNTARMRVNAESGKPGEKSFQFRTGQIPTG